MQLWVGRTGIWTQFTVGSRKNKERLAAKKHKTHIIRQIENHLKQAIILISVKMV
jgi:hypothetical protein